ncbi:diacylglycerol/lipid kinase family protein [Patescibacteria group bacterium]
MYFYIYDSFLSDKKYDKILAKIENRLANLEINGKIIRISKLKSLKDNITEEIEKGAINIIAVGDDETILKVINVIADYNVIFGIIPVGYKINIAKLLGIPYAEEACDVLSSRRITKIDLGKVNNRYFISDVSLRDDNFEILCDGKYTVIPINGNNVKICNLGNQIDESDKEHFNPSDGFLEVIVQEKFSVINRMLKKKQGTKSIFPIKEARITSSKSLPVAIDSQTIFKTPLDINIVPQKLKIIVGNGRIF